MNHNVNYLICRVSDTLPTPMKGSLEPQGSLTNDALGAHTLTQEYHEMRQVFFFLKKRKQSQRY